MCVCVCVCVRVRVSNSDAYKCKGQQPTFRQFASTRREAFENAGLVACAILLLCLSGTVKVNLKEGKMFYLTTHSTHFIYGYMASDIW